MIEYTPMRPFFSIIIPTLNEEEYVQNLLSELEKQKERNFEVIVVDGDSKDKTRQIIMELVHKLPIELVKVDKPNLPLQKNLGAKHAKGQYLLFLDADMSISKSFTGLAEKLISQKKGLFFQPYTLPLEKKEYPEVMAVFPILNRLIEFSQNFNKPFSAGPAMIWEKNAFLTIGGFDNIFGEDHYIVRKAHMWGIRPKFIFRLKVLFSLRRMKREGRLQVLYKVFISHIYLLFNEKIKKKFFTYDMGGHIYKPIDNQSKKLIQPKQLLKKFKKIFAEIVSEV